MCNVKFLLRLKFLHGTTNANEAPLTSIEPCPKMQQPTGIAFKYWCIEIKKPQTTSHHMIWCTLQMPLRNIEPLMLVRWKQPIHNGQKATMWSIKTVVQMCKCVDPKLVHCKSESLFCCHFWEGSLFHTIHTWHVVKDICVLTDVPSKSNAAHPVCGSSMSFPEQKNILLIN